MTELVWFMFMLWILFFALSFKLKDAVVPAVGGILGIALGIQMLDGISQILGLLFVILGFYQLYTAAFKETT